MTRKQRRLAALERQIVRLTARLTDWERISRRLSTARLFSAGVLLVALILALTLEDSLPYWIVASVAAVIFGVLVALHNRVLQAIADFEGWRRIARANIARMNLDWAHIPPALPLDPLPDHPFEIDLDITGDHSLHRLLSTAVTREGGTRLRDWLLTLQPDRDEILRRQALVDELARLPVFRGKLALRGAARESWRAAHALDWLAQPSVVDTRALLFLTLLALVNVALFMGFVLGVVPPIWRFTIPLYFVLFLVFSRGMGDIFQGSLTARDSVEKLGAIFRYLETYRYGRNQHLRALCAPFLDPRRRPSTELGRIRWVLAAAGFRSNIFFWLPLNLILPWDHLVAYALDRTRTRLRTLMPGWLQTWYDLEALSSLANFRYLNPDHAFPTIEGRAQFKGAALGHPLIPDRVKVRNDFALEGVGQVVIITGSNMAGKSSFLRTLGLALVMGYAGGVVDAASLSLSLFRLFTAIRVTDSVTDGFSYFYAEVRRLKALLDAVEQPHAHPVFFLIDEIFKGTNNRERLIGSRAYIRALVGKNAVGAISTHDLELVRLADELPGVSNDHFREEVIDGNMVFDYKLRHGPSPTTNALKIMQLAGLPVEDA